MMSSIAMSHASDEHKSPQHHLVAWNIGGDGGYSDSNPKKRGRESLASACTSCHTSKVKCDKARPCSRCKRLGRSCVPYVPKRRGRRRLRAKNVCDGKAPLTVPRGVATNSADMGQLAWMKRMAEIFEPIFMRMLEKPRTRRGAVAMLEAHMRQLYHHGKNASCQYVHDWARDHGVVINTSSVVSQEFQVIEGFEHLSLADKPTPNEPVLTSSPTHAMFYVLFQADRMQLHCNPKFTELTGYTVADVHDGIKRGVDVLEFLVHPDDVMDFMQCKARQFACVGYAQCEHIFKFNTKGNPDGVVCYFMGRSDHSFTPLRRSMSWQLIPLPQSKHFDLTATRGGSSCCVGMAQPVVVPAMTSFGASIRAASAAPATQVPITPNAGSVSPLMPQHQHMAAPADLPSLKADTFGVASAGPFPFAAASGAGDVSAGKGPAFTGHVDSGAAHQLLLPDVDELMKDVDFKDFIDEVLADGTDLLAAVGSGGSAVVDPLADL